MSADVAYWDAPAVAAPRWTVRLGTNWLNQLADVVRRNDLRVTLALNLAVHDPQMAAALARAVADALPRGDLVGLAIGNEPDLFFRQTVLDKERVPGTLVSTPLDWAQNYSASSYWHDWRAYAQAIARTVPDIPLAGPETTRLTPAWMTATDGLGRFAPRSLTVHRYPSSRCWSKVSPFYPRVSLMLSEVASARLAAGLRGPVAFAHRRGMSLRVTELNSVSCGGMAGVSDSFATALWAPDTLFEMLREGVDGVNWHIRPRMLNAPFEVRGGRVRALPELYGLALFADMLGPQARRIGTRVSAAHQLDLKAWAVRTATQTEVLIINKGPRAAAVSLCCAASGSYVRLKRLLAPTVTAIHGLTLAGQTIGSDGRWHGRSVEPRISSTGGRYRIAVGGYSAVLVRGPQISLTTAALSKRRARRQT
jgi:hypothetical protein